MFIFLTGCFFDSDTKTISMGRNIEDIKLSLDGNLWIADASLKNSGIYVIDTNTNSLIKGPIDTNIKPRKIEFVSDKAIVLTSAFDFSSGSFSVIDKSNYSVSNNFNPTISDLALSVYGDYFYIIERFQSDNIKKFYKDNPSSFEWNFSTMDDDDNLSGENISSSNPYKMVCETDSKCYLLRYGSKRVWVVNPEATSQEDFKIGEINLSAYDDGDGFPEICSAVIADDKLFIAMQRLNRTSTSGKWDIKNPSYIAVIDISTEAEIDTGKGENGLKGIKLPIRNPQGRLIYKNDKIYLSAGGKLVGDDSSYGGVVSIDVFDYSVSPVIYPDHRVTNIEIVSATKGYLVEYVDWMNLKLYEFNPETGIVSNQEIKW